MNNHNQPSSRARPLNGALAFRSTYNSSSNEKEKLKRAFIKTENPFPKSAFNAISKKNKTE